MAVVDPLRQQRVRHARRTEAAPSAGLSDDETRGFTDDASSGDHDRLIRAVLQNFECRPMSYDPGLLPTTQILADMAAIERVLRARDVIRTNNLIGDIAESVVHAHYGGTRGSLNQAGWDVLTQDGERLQVRGMRQTATNRRTRLGVIRGSNYDALVVVVLDEDYRVAEVLRLERETVEELFMHNDYVNARQPYVTRALRTYPGVHVLELSDALIDATPT